MSDDQASDPKRPRVTLEQTVAMGKYSNFASIAHNFSEVVLDFGRTLPGRQDIPVVARIMMNPFHAKQLLRALEHNLKIYEKNFGAINEPPPGPADGLPPEGAN